MSSLITQVFVLAGHYAGQTVRLGKYQFKDGKCTLKDSPEQIALHARSLERNWQALPEGDERIAQIEAAMKEAQHEQREVPPGEPGPNGTAEVHGDGEPGGEGAAAGGEAGEGGDDAGAAAGDAAEGTAGQDGQQAGLMANEKLTRAILDIDPELDSNWTADGKPAMKAVEAAYGFAGITRADVEAAAAGYTREAAREIRRQEAAEAAQR